MIHEVDESLAGSCSVMPSTGPVSSSASRRPRRSGASRRNAPTINVYLYDIREDLARREVEYEDIRDSAGRVTERRPPPRRYTLSYLVTVWTQGDEHRIREIGQCNSCLS